MLFVRLNRGINHHQAALADAMYGILGDNYVYIEFGREASFQKGSYTGMTKGVDYYEGRPYILKMYESEESERRARELIIKADVLHTGGEPEELTRERLLSGKLTFRSSEHVRKGTWWENVKKLIKLRRYYNPLSNPNYRLLCQSAYMANDMRYCDKSYREKCYKFAYFTEIPQLDIDKIIANRDKEKVHIVWCARFIDWKHPELPVLLANKLVESGRTNFELQMIGADTMPLWNKTKEDVERLGLQKHVILTGGLKNTEVLERMRQSQIFLFTSDRGEGWGAVLNEAMGAGCACVASHDIGSVPFLLKNNVNGLIYKSRSLDSLYDKVAYLYDKPNECERYGKAAYQTITTEWSAQFAAECLVKLSESILDGREIQFEDGPCAKAYPTEYKKLLG